MFWHVLSSEYHAPRAAGSGNHARKMLVTDGHPTDCTAPLLAHSSAMAGR